MAGGTVARTAHFVLHRAVLDAPSVSAKAASGTPDPAGRAMAAATGPGSPRSEALFPVCAPWIGAVVPKRWAKRAVTRNGIKRQIYSLSATFEGQLPAAAHVVRLRAGFPRDQFPSAWSDALKESVRRELLQLFARAPK